MLMKVAQAPHATDFDRFVERELAEHRQVLEDLSAALNGPLNASIVLMAESFREGGKLMLFGNGGSAADAQHLAAEFLVRYKKSRPAMSAMALTTDPSTMTACGNDLGFDAVFERQIEGLGRRGDVAIGISTSGRSRNVLRGLSKARAMGLATLGLSGGSGGDLSSVCDVLITVPSPVTARIQEMHILIGHIWCKALEVRLGGDLHHAI